MCLTAEDRRWSEYHQHTLAFLLSTHSQSNCISFIPLPNLRISLSFSSSSVFGYPSLLQCASSHRRRSRASGKAGWSWRWQNQDVSSQRDAGVFKLGQRLRRAAGLPLTTLCMHTHTYTHICPICSSLFITSHLHVLISWQEVERHRKRERERNMRWTGRTRRTKKSVSFKF